jgi:hypothetical protein
MNKQNDRHHGIRLTGPIAIVTLLWVATLFAVKLRPISPGQGLALRVALVVAGIGGFLPWVYVYVKSIRAQDEFNQRIHLVGIAIAFALTGVASYACDFLERAGFIPAFPASGVWVLMVILWFGSMVGTSRYYR